MRVDYRYVGERGTFEMPELRGHSLEAHCQAILAFWLAKTADEIGFDGDEDDAEDWRVERVRCTSRRVSFTGRPYRGEGIRFSFVPPVM